MKRIIFSVLSLIFIVALSYAGKIVDVDKLNQWIQTNQRDEAVVPPPVTCPAGQHWDVTLQKCVVDVPVPPPVGVLGTKTNPIKLDQSYTPVRSGFTYGNSYYQIGDNAKVYFEIDPALLKESSSSFQMTIKGMNGPLAIYKAYYDKNTQSYKPADDVYFTAKGCLDYVASSASHPFSSTKFLYALENGGGSWGIQLYVQMY